MGFVSFQIMLGPTEIVHEVDSTNRVLLERARMGAPHGTVLVADHQTAGRGRRGRTWEAEPHTALLVSVLLRPQMSPASAFLLTFAAGLAALDATEDVCGVRPSLKWPNDVIVETTDGTLKLAGLLAESVVQGSSLSAVVVGMGFNLRRFDSRPAGAIALDDLSPTAISRDELLQAWLTRFDVRCAEAELKESIFLDEYRVNCGTLGQHVRIEDEGGAVAVGRVVDVDRHGHLVVDLEGHRRHIVAADVVHLRAV